MVQPRTQIQLTIDIIFFKSLPLLLPCYKNLSMCYAVKIGAFIGQFFNPFFFNKFIFNTRHAMKGGAATVHTSLLSGSSYLFYQINCLTENIFPSNSSVRSNELRKFFPYNKIWGTTEYKRREFRSKFNICVFVNFYQISFQTFTARH